jgi:hypothetical protein
LSWPTFCSASASAARRWSSAFRYGTGSMRNSTSPAVNGLLLSTGTSTTLPLTPGITGVTAK